MLPLARICRTRIQRATALKGETAWTRFSTVSAQMFREEGPSAFYKGITPRVARVAPGQAVVFAVYERIKLFVSTRGSKTDSGVDETDVPPPPASRSRSPRTSTRSTPSRSSTSFCTLLPCRKYPAGCLPSLLYHALPVEQEGERADCRLSRFGWSGGPLCSFRQSLPCFTGCTNER